MSQTLTYSWQLSGSGWAIDYTATVTISVSRPYGSDTATVTASGSMTTPPGNGDGNAAWKFWIKIGNTSYTKTISSGYHAPGRTDTFKYTFPITVGAGSGALSGSADFQAYDNNNGYGAWAGTKNWSQGYGNKGASTIATKTNVNLKTDGTAYTTIGFVSYSNSFTHKLTASCNGATTSKTSISGANNSTITETLAFPVSFINAINTTTSATCTITLYTYSSATQTAANEIGSNSTTITLNTPDDIYPSISSVTFAKVSALSSTYFSDKVCTLIDKVQVGWVEDLTNNYNAAITSRTVSINGETLHPSTNSATTETVIKNPGPQNVSVSITDARGSGASAIINPNTLAVYKYFYPSIQIKYNHSGSTYKVNITGKIAYVGGSNGGTSGTKSLVLDVYKGDSTTSLHTYTLTSSIGTQTGTTYEAEYSFDIEQIIDAQYITDIATDTYRFEATVTDTVTSVMAKVYSGISVMSFEAGGTGITAHKPMTFEQGIRPMDSNGITGLEILPTRTSDRLGGRIKLDRGEDTARDAYIDTYESALRVVDRNPSTAVRASLDLSNGYLDVGGLYLTPNNYMSANRVGLYPPTIASGSISSGNSGNATSWWRILMYSSSYKEIVSIMQLNVNFSSSYGSGYYANLTMMVPTHFFSEGTGNAHWQISANSHSGSGGGIYSGNVHSMNASTGAVGFFLANWVSGTITSLQIVLHGYRY